MRKSEIIVCGGIINFTSFKPFSRLKATICKYGSLIKTKISRTCVCKEYESKMKIVQEQWRQLKMKLFLAYNMKRIVYLRGGEPGVAFGGDNENLVDGSTGGRGLDFRNVFLRNLLK